ncbi:Crossover junction endonuclease [Nymphaea thermarum]|nr:Crossover junction endonuclease [Nymphaea thermarum]
MSPPVTVDILSDGEEDDVLTYNPDVPAAKRQGDETVPFLVIDTPQKEVTTPLVVPETPFSCRSDVFIVKCTESQSFTGLPNDKASGCSNVICLDSDNDSAEIFVSDNSKEDQCLDSFPMAESGIMNELLLQNQVMDIGLEHEKEVTTDTECLNSKLPRKKQSKEEKMSLKEERKLKRESFWFKVFHAFIIAQQEKLQKEALKAEAAEMKKLQKEKERWEKGKLAIKSIVLKIDTKVVEMGLIGGSLLSKLAEKGLEFHITSNPIESSILWTMNVPDQIAQLSSMGADVPYILFVHEAEAFCNMVTNESATRGLFCSLSLSPSLYLNNPETSGFTSNYISREQVQYKNPSNANSWKRPPVEEVLSMLTTHFSRVHSRQCLDEAEVAEHIVGLTCSLANCQFRKKLTRLSINANGSHIPKGFFDKNLVKKNVWLRALTAIPKVQPRFAVAIWKKYPTMRCLLNVYMDPCRSVHEKEFLLKDLMTEDVLGNEDRRVGEVCSKRVYRILMAQSGSIKTDDVEDGADFF